MSLTINYGPFGQDANINLYVMSFFDVKETALLRRVCRVWCNWIENLQEVWKEFFKREGIPLVEGERTSYFEDFKVLYPITITKRHFRKCFGDILVSPPSISVEIFDKLFKKDPFRNPQLQEGEIIKDNYVFVFFPGMIKRSLKDTSLFLDEIRDLQRLRKSEFGFNTIEFKELDQSIPLSLPNLSALSSYPLTATLPGPVFNKLYEGEREKIFNLTEHCYKTNELYLMKKHMFIESKKIGIMNQVDRLQQQGAIVTPLKVRVLFDVMLIMIKGSCPDGKGIYVITADLTGRNLYCIIPKMGNFREGIGLDVCHNDGQSMTHERAGVVPCLYYASCENVIE